MSVKAGEPAPTDILRIIQECGLCIADGGKTKNGISAISKLEHIYSGMKYSNQGAGPTALMLSIKTAIAAWGTGSQSFKAEVLGGLGHFFLRYGDSANAVILAEKLAKTPGGAPGLSGTAHVLKNVLGRDLDICVASTLVGIYNSGKKKNLLEPWTSHVQKD